ncbi:MAG: sigma-E processing peptidase SpoIIGA [Clostridia bacterium]|nr:sigma-E processing peptidase SpoIIGA [Clostridia bacterium]
MIIYADILFLLNAFIDYVLLVVSAILLKSPLRRKRFLLSSLIAGAYALTLLIAMPAVLAVLSKIAVCFIMIWVAFGKMNVRLFVMHSFVFLLFNVLTGGFVLLLQQFDSRDFYSNGSVAYINITPLYFMIALSFCYLSVNIGGRILHKKRICATIYRVLIEYGQKQYSLYGFFDTGNALNEPFSAEPVSLVKAGIIHGFEEEPFKRVIPYSSLGGEGMLYAIKVKMAVYDGKKEILHRQVYVAQSREAFCDMQYDMILNPKLLTETECL